MELIEMAQNVNFSADTRSYAHIQEKFDENVNTLYEYCSQNPQTIISANNNEGYHVGTAFYNILKKMEEPELLSISDDSTKFKFSLVCAVICLKKAIDMGTVQSGIAAGYMLEILKNYENHLSSIVFGLTNEYIKENFTNADTILKLKPINGDIKTIISKRLYLLKYYVAQITRLQDAFKDADIDACKLGNLYLNALSLEQEERLNGYMSFGII